MDNPERVEQVRGELKRLRRLATMSHPFVPDENATPVDELAEVREKLKKNRKRGKYFGI